MVESTLKIHNCTTAKLTQKLISKASDANSDFDESIWESMVSSRKHNALR